MEKKNLIKDGRIMLGIYFVCINVITFLTYAIDKDRARKGKWRIRESVLLGLCVVGGTLGGLLGMRLYHHKTKKPKFYIGVPTILVMQIAMFIWVLYGIWYRQ